MVGVEDDRRQVIRDYLPRVQPRHPRLGHAQPGRDAHTRHCSTSRPSPPCWTWATTAPSTPTPASNPWGYRLLAKVPRLPDAMIGKIVARYGNLQKILAGHRRGPRHGGWGQPQHRLHRQGRPGPAWPSRASSTATTEPAEASTTRRPSAGPLGQALPLGDAVPAVGLLDPTEAEKGGDGLVDPLSGRTDQARPAPPG